MTDSPLRSAEGRPAPAPAAASAEGTGPERAAPRPAGPASVAVLPGGQAAPAPQPAAQPAPQPAALRGPAPAEGPPGAGAAAPTLAHERDAAERTRRGGGRRSGVVRPARLRARHYGLLASFVLLVVIPTAVAAWYLWTRAVDQYSSTVGFSVQREEAKSAIDFFGGFTQMTGTGSADTDILYEFIRGQELVARLDAEMDLRSLYSAPWQRDPVFAFAPGGSIEDLMSYWRRIVRISYDSHSGLIELRVHAFDPETARHLATRIFEESSRMINALSEQARADATRYAALELERAVARLTQARQAMTEFRMRTQIVDPTADIQGQMGLLNTLQQQLAAQLIELDLLREVARANDPRIEQAERRVAVIENRIAAERRKFGIGGEGPGGEDYATLIAEYERLSVEREFAEQAYTAALKAYDAAFAEAQRQSRYLAAYISPTLAERSTYPDRPVLLGLTALFLLLAWSIAALIYYSVRDRR